MMLKSRRCTWTSRRTWVRIQVVTKRASRIHVTATKQATKQLCCARIPEIRVSGLRMVTCVCDCVVDVVDCVYGVDGVCGCGSYYMVAEPRSPTGYAHYVPSMHHPPWVCPIAPRRLPMNFSNYGRIGRCLAKMGRGTKQEELCEQLCTTGRWTDDTTRKLIDANYFFITSGLGQLDTATQAPRHP